MIAVLDKSHGYAKELVSVLAIPAAILGATGKVICCNEAFTAALSLETDPCGAVLHDVLGPSGNSTFSEFMFDGVVKDENLFFELPAGRFRLSVNRCMGFDDDPIFLCQLSPDAEIDNSRLQFLLEHLDQGVWNYNIPKNQFAVTPAWRRIRKIEAIEESYDFKSTDPDWWLENIHYDDRARVKESFEGLVLGAHDSTSVQCRYHLGNDEWLWLLCSAKVMARDEEGHATQLVGMDTDITSIKQGEVEQLEVMNKLQLAINVSGMGVYEFDSATAKVYWDDRLLEIYGLPKGQNDLPEDLWETFIHPDDRAETVAAADLALVKKHSFFSDYRIVRKDGDIRYIRSAARFLAVSGSSGKMVGVNIDVTEDYLRTEELEQARKLLEHDARHDALTGLANRRLLDEHTTALLSQLGPSDELAVLHIDLDHFKLINDTFGHAAGDQVLVRVAETLKTLVADDGLVCRNGGDEFVVILENFEDEAALRELCQNIISQMAEPMIIQGSVRSIGLSIGCVMSSAGIADAGEVFLNADVALYAAKSAGRSCYKMFVPELRAVSQVDVTTYHALASAMDAGHIFCYFQPQFDTETLEVVGAEALVRWDCPKRGMIMPDEFIPAAQATGLCARLDQVVLDFVLEEQTHWAKSGLDVPMVAMNISVDRLMGPEFIEQTIAKLKPHHSISFELLETSFLDHRTDELARALAKVRQAGIRIDLDDFGSGHASIVALQTVKPDRVKIDRMLVDPLQDNPAQLLILEALVRIARLENCGVVVEGIETQNQLDAALDLECEVVQGFMLGRPVASADLAAILPIAIDEGSKRA